MYKAYVNLLRKFFFMFVPLALSAQAEVERIILDNGTVAVEITPDIGGRLLSAKLPGQPNFLKTGEAVITDPDPVVSPEANNIAYFGHEIWVGPQSHWWTQQRLNDQRRAAKAVWPPDPYLILAKNKLVEKSPQRVILQSPNSPVSGVVVKKTYSLTDGAPNQIKLDVEAMNIRDTEVAWDIWYNTRVPYTTSIYVPVTDMKDIRIEHFSDATFDGLEHRFNNGIFSLENSSSIHKQGRKGKVFIQPAQGWMAAFRDKQLLIIQFALQPLNAIHPEQGQVELYQEFLNKKPHDGILELEFHAPYKTLSPGAAMSASETWTLLPYDGTANYESHLAFLVKLKAEGIIRF